MNGDEGIELRFPAELIIRLRPDGGNQVSAELLANVMRRHAEWKVRPEAVEVVLPEEPLRHLWADFVVGGAVSVELVRTRAVTVSQVTDETLARLVEVVAGDTHIRSHKYLSLTEAVWSELPRKERGIKQNGLTRGLTAIYAYGPIEWWHPVFPGAEHEKHRSASRTAYRHLPINLARLDQLVRQPDFRKQLLALRFTGPRAYEGLTEFLERVHVLGLL